ncbi:MAG: hypothetical protein AAFQ82_02325, partial [Myxococcota bacterium]
MRKLLWVSLVFVAAACGRLKLDEPGTQPLSVKPLPESDSESESEEDPGTAPTVDTPEPVETPEREP